MKTKEKFKTISSYLGDNFKEWFGYMEFEDKKSKLYSKKLEKFMLDSEILSKFNPTELTIDEVFNYLKDDADKKDYMLFYCKDMLGVLRAVSVDWCGDGWDVRADSVEGSSRWLDGSRVFSRNPLGTQTISPSDSLTLAIETVRKAGHTVILKKNWYITGRGEVYEMHDSDKSKKRREFLGAYSTEEEAKKVRDIIKLNYGEK